MPHRLLTKRDAALKALRNGFRYGVEFGPQLAQHSNSDLALLLQGRTTLNVQDILSCFDWSDMEHFPPSKFLYELLQDADVFDEEGRLTLLRWCTGLNALSVNCPDRKVKLVEDDTNRKQVDGRLPTAATCSNEIYLPNYSSKEVLRIQLKCALDSFKSDASFEQQ